MKNNLIKLATLLIFSSNIAHAGNCVNSKTGEIAKINGHTLTIWNSTGKKCIETVVADKIVPTPLSIRYVDNSFNVLFSMNRKGKLHQGGKVDIKSRYILYKNTKYTCKK